MNAGTKLVKDVVAGEFVRLYTENTMQYTKAVEDGVVIKQDGQRAPSDAMVFVK